MPARPIVLLGNPLLREISAPVSAADAAPVWADLRDTLHEFQRTHGFGRGISAVQIGEAVRLIYMEFGGQSYALRNPAYDFQSKDKFQLWDDCFSFPGILVKLERSVSVRIRYEDDAGKVQLLEAEGPFSELVQHEMDHLDGVLAIDRALDRNSFSTREEYLTRYRPAV